MMTVEQTWALATEHKLNSIGSCMNFRCSSRITHMYQLLPTKCSGFVTDSRLQDIANAYQAWKEWMIAGHRDETFEPIQPPEPSVYVLLDELIKEDNDE